MRFKNIIDRVTLIVLFGTIFSLSLEAKDPNILAYVDRGIKYYPKYIKSGFTKIGKASWYGKPFHGRLTANGERYNMYNMTAAHRTYAMGTHLKITNLANNKSVKVRVNDRGPFYSSRDIDLSYGAARKLGIVHKGIGRVKIEVLSSRHSKKKHHSQKSSKKSFKKSFKKSSQKSFRQSLKKSSKKKYSSKKYKFKKNIIKKHATKKYKAKKSLVTKKKSHKVVKKSIYHKKNHYKKRNRKIQIASFFSIHSAKKFQREIRLKNTKVVKVYLKQKKRHIYKVIALCTPYEAKRLLKSKKFSGAYQIS